MDHDWQHAASLRTSERMRSEHDLKRFKLWHADIFKEPHRPSFS